MSRGVGRWAAQIGTVNDKRKLRGAQHETNISERKFLASFLGFLPCVVCVLSERVGSFPCAGNHGEAAHRLLAPPQQMREDLTPRSRRLMC